MDIITLPLIIACALLDRLRGIGEPFPRAVVAPLYGWAVAALLGLGWCWWTPAIVAAHWAGSSFGWGEPLAAALEGRPMVPANLEAWQVGPLKTSAWLALIARGAIWGSPAIAVCCWQPVALWLIPAYMVAMPSAVALARVLPIPDTDKWAAQEALRGLLAGALLAAAVVL